jgi:hypothetical protein
MMLMLGERPNAGQLLSSGNPPTHFGGTRLQIVGCRLLQQIGCDVVWENDRNELNEIDLRLSAAGIGCLSGLVPGRAVFDLGENT